MNNPGRKNIPLVGVAVDAWSEGQHRAFHVLLCGHRLYKDRPGPSPLRKRCYRCAGLVPPIGKEPY